MTDLDYINIASIVELPDVRYWTAREYPDILTIDGVNPNVKWSVMQLVDHFESTGYEGLVMGMDNFPTSRNLSEWLVAYHAYLATREVNHRFVDTQNYFRAQDALFAEYIEDYIFDNFDDAVRDLGSESD
jgi:hypothetical protein